MNSHLPALPEAESPVSGPISTHLTGWILFSLIIGLLGGIGYCVARLTNDLRPRDSEVGLQSIGERSTPEQIDTLVTDLDAEEFTARSDATRRLIEIGEPALSRLRVATTSENLETAWRAEEAIREIEWRREARIERTGSNRP